MPFFPCKSLAFFLMMITHYHIPSEFFFVCVCLIWIIPKFPALLFTKQRGCFQPPKSPKSVALCLGFFPPKPTEAESIFLLFFLAKIRVFQSKTQLGCAPELSPLCATYCVFFLGHFGQNRAFFLAFFEWALCAGRGRGHGLTGIAFPAFLTISCHN